MNHETRTLKCPARRLVHNPWALAPVALFPFAGYLLFASFEAHVGLAVFALSLLILSLPLSILVLTQLPRRDSGELQVEQGTLLWNGRPVLGRRGLRDAVAFTNDDCHGVRVRSPWRTAYFEVGTREEADRIVSALGLDGAQAATGFSGQLGITLLVGIASVFASLGKLWLLGAWLPLGTVAAYTLGLLGLLLARGRWVVGSDGLQVRRGFRRARFVPYSEIESVEVKDAVLTVRLCDQGRLVLSSRDDADKGPWPVVGANALAARINQARALAGPSEPTGGLMSFLARGGRDVATWRRALAQLGEMQATFRASAVPRALLWSAVEDPKEPIEIRAAAAGALRTALRDEERVRLRVAATACASPRLRVALEAAEANDDEAFAEALDAVASDEAS